MGRLRTYLQVEHFRSEYVVVDDLDIEARLGRHEFEELGKLGPTDAIGAVDRQLAGDLPTLEGAGKGLAELPVVALLADLAVGLRGALGVDAAREVVELRRREDLVVDVLGAGGIKRVRKCAH
jgi:hypothetical protein